MPSTSIFFRDPDGHLIEYLAMLNEEPKPYLGIIPWNKWLASKEKNRPIKTNSIIPKFLKKKEKPYPTF